MKYVGIIGAGAVGCYFFWAMKDIPETEVFFIADLEHMQKIKKGITINDTLYHPCVKAPADVTDIDLILVATKYSGLDSAILMLQTVSKPDTIILSLLNGVDSEEKIKAANVTGTVLYSIMRIASRRTSSGITFNPEITQGVVFGATTENEKAAVSIAASIFEKTNARYQVADDILKQLWIKYATNIANNLPQAVLGTDASLYVDSEHGYFIASKLWAEVRQVALTRGIELPEEVMIFTVCPKTAKYSTLQDLEACRHTEIDMFAGQLIKMAQENDIDVPYTTYTYHAIKALEEKNDHIIGC